VHDSTASTTGPDETGSSQGSQSSQGSNRPGALRALGARVRAVNGRYDGEQPIPAYAGLMVTYSTAVAGLIVVSALRHKPEARVPAADLVLYAIATHKVARIVAKDPVTSPLRAPFTELQGVQGPAELEEQVTGEGWRRAVGELLTCPFCLGQWVSTAFVFGGALAPRATRLVAGTFAVHAAADSLQFVYAALERTDH
jgi:hypothetical protein